MLFSLSAQDHTIVLSGITFTPNQLTINVGETVRWDNQDGFHNVNGTTQSYPDNPEGFGNGSAMAAPWTFDHTFTVPGTYDYHCDPHVSLGMTGTITVLGGSGAGDIVISGVFDTQPAGAGVKGIELKATADIADISIFGVGSANNGTGSSGVETQLPAIAVSAGDCIYVVDDSLKFIDYFGFSPTIEGDAANINGDDAIELYENGDVIDVFGEVDVDGTGEPWEHLDGWAYRKSGTGPDGATFVLNNWTFSGVNALDNVPDNASSPIPFPTCTYSATAPTDAAANDDNISTDIDTDVTINVLGNDITPNALTSITVTSGPDHGTTTVNGVDNITYMPDAGYCGEDGFIYEICDANGCDEAFVSITIDCPADYPVAAIGDVTTVDAAGQPNSLGETYQLQGIVHGIDFQGGGAIQFALIDQTGGISLFSGNDFGYTVTEGDELVVQGTISQFNCLTQISPDTLWMTSSGNPLVTPQVTTTIDDEIYESELVQVNNLNYVDIADWAGDGSSFNVALTDGTNTITMRIDNDNELSSMPAPQAPFNVIGLGGQFDNNGPCDQGYQLLPRYAADIIPVTSTNEPYLAQQIAFYPNPASSKLTIDSELEIDAISVSNLLGQVLINQEKPGSTIDVDGLQAGVYLLTFQVEEATWTGKFVKK